MHDHLSLLKGRITTAITDAGLFPITPQTEKSLKEADLRREQLESNLGSDEEEPEGGFLKNSQNNIESIIKQLKDEETSHENFK